MRPLWCRCSRDSQLMAEDTAFSVTAAVPQPGHPWACPGVVPGSWRQSGITALLWCLCGQGGGSQAGPGGQGHGRASCCCSAPPGTLAPWTGRKNRLCGQALWEGSSGQGCHSRVPGVWLRAGLLPLVLTALERCWAPGHTALRGKSHGGEPEPPAAPALLRPGSSGVSGHPESHH